MLKQFLCTGDTHGGKGTLERLEKISQMYPNEKSIGIIILGDSGLNFYLNNTDIKYKKIINNFNYILYLVRGNHEQRPELIDGIIKKYDDNVKGFIYIEEEFPNIRYFIDGNIYNLNGYTTLVIGGGYSVDKYFRLNRAGYSLADELIANPKKTGWFKDELLTQKEMEDISKKVNNKEFDFILTHVFPLSWEPTDLFLNFIDQKAVNKDMEKWLDNIKENVSFKVWLAGHYHQDRLERPNAQMFFQEVESMDDIFARVMQPATAPDYKHIKSPNYYMEDN